MSVGALLTGLPTVLHRAPALGQWWVDGHWKPLSLLWSRKEPS